VAEQGPPRISTGGRAQGILLVLPLVSGRGRSSIPPVNDANPQRHLHTFAAQGCALGSSIARPSADAAASSRVSAVTKTGGARPAPTRRVLLSRADAIGGHHTPGAGAAPAGLPPATARQYVRSTLSPGTRAAHGGPPAAGSPAQSVGRWCGALPDAPPDSGDHLCRHHPCDKDGVAGAWRSDGPHPCCARLYQEEQVREAVHRAREEEGRQQP
jgi:hypothetical protein